MIHAKGIPTFPGPAIAGAHKKAIVPLQVLVAAHNEAADYELLGLCHVRVGDEASAPAAQSSAGPSLSTASTSDGSLGIGSLKGEKGHE